ncbi:MAG: hypothetical protein VYB54_00210 [Pseudomonadota bacterium]|nr:hypothetical protein [Pseudomonadota bacterium]
MIFNPQKNPDQDKIDEMLASSEVNALRKLTDEISGDIWCWPAEQSNFEEAMNALGIVYASSRIIVGDY